MRRAILKICDHSLVLLVLVNDTEKTRNRYSDALKVAVFACVCVS
jgi:hypothetical protein